jgi:hypothetical protein
MGTAVERLTRLVDAPDRFTHSHTDLSDAQIAAVNELFQERKGRIKLLAGRAKEGNVSEVRSLADIVPLLFPHTAYKSYPESFLSEQKWDRLNKWLGTISPYPIAPIETADLADMDAWVDRMCRAARAAPPARPPCSSLPRRTWSGPARTPWACTRGAPA